MHLGADDSYNIIADSTKTVINFYCESSELLIFGKVVGSCSAVPWCGYVIYPGLRRVGKFDFASFTIFLNAHCFSSRASRNYKSSTYIW